MYSAAHPTRVPSRSQPQPIPTRARAQTQTHYNPDPNASPAAHALTQQGDGEVRGRGGSDVLDLLLVRLLVDRRGAVRAVVRVRRDALAVLLVRDVPVEHRGVRGRDHW